MKGAKILDEATRGEKKRFIPAYKELFSRISVEVVETLSYMHKCGEIF